MAGVITDTVSSAPASCTSTIASYPKSLSTSVKEVDDDNEISNRGRAFSSVPMGVVDPDEILLRRIRADDSPNKINIMPGVFTDENGGYYEFEAIRKVGVFFLPCSITLSCTLSLTSCGILNRPRTY